MINIKVDTREFDKAYADYISFSKKSLEEIANKMCYEVGRLAVVETKGTPKELIQTELTAASKVNSKASLANILVNLKRGRLGKKGFYGSAMTKATESLIKKKMRTGNFVRSGWIAAIRKMATFVPNKNGVTIAKRAKSTLGSAWPARNVAGKATAAISNNVLGGKGETSKPARVTTVEEEGLARAIQRKTADLYVYINRKLSEGAARFRR